MNLNSNTTTAVIGFATPTSSDPNAPQSSPFSFFVPMILMFVIFYFVLIRPQSKQRKEMEKMISEVKTGDEVVTSGGIVGTVANVKEKSIMLKVADNVKIELLKANIATINKPTTTKADKGA
jgi:preprotein translocase subunit YajC